MSEERRWTLTRKHPFATMLDGPTLKLGESVDVVPESRLTASDHNEAIALWRPDDQHPWREWESDKSDEVTGEMCDFVPASYLDQLRRERDKAEKQADYFNETARHNSEIAEARVRELEEGIRTLQKRYERRERLHSSDFTAIITSALSRSSPAPGEGGGDG